MTYIQLIQKIRDLETEKFYYGTYSLSVLYKNRWYDIVENKGNIIISSPFNHRVLGELYIEKSYSPHERETAYNDFYEFVIGDIEKDCYFGGGF